jgi:hypothetical protein
MVLSLMALHWYWWVAAILNVSFVNAFNAVTTVLFDATVTDGSFTASDCLLTCGCVSQFAGLTLSVLMIGFVHNW